MKYLKLFERFKYEHTGSIISPEKLNNFSIPDEIQEMMKTWPVIFKSPYGESFYSSTDIGWGSKPANSYRVSDHWNFITRENKHCQTSEVVKNNSHITIAKYDAKTHLYDVILSLPTAKHIDKLNKNEIKLKYLKDPETIWRKKILKDRITNGEILIKLTYDGKDYERIVKKFTGGELRIEDSNGNLVFSEKYMGSKPGKTTHLELTDKQGNIVENEL